MCRFNRHVNNQRFYFYSFSPNSNLLEKTNLICFHQITMTAGLVVTTSPAAQKNEKNYLQIIMLTTKNYYVIQKKLFILTAKILLNLIGSKFICFTKFRKLYSIEK